MGQSEIADQHSTTSKFSLQAKDAIWSYTDHSLYGPKSTLQRQTVPVIFLIRPYL